VVHEEDFLIFIKIFLILRLIGPQKGPVPLFEQIWIPIPQACFLPTWNWPSGSWEEVDQRKVNGRWRRQRRRTDCDGYSSHEPSAQVS